MKIQSWKKWDKPEDIPIGLKRTIAESSFVPLLDPIEAEHLKRTVMESFGEVLDIYFEASELRWRISHVHRAYPQLPMQAVFRIIEIEIGVSADYLKKLWYGNRRKAAVQAVVTRKLREGKP